MAKLKDKMFNRVIEGDLSDLSEKDGQAIAQVVSGGTQLYKHTMALQEDDFTIVVIGDFNEPIADTMDLSQLYNMEGYGCIISIVIMNTVSKKNYNVLVVGNNYFYYYDLSEESIIPFDISMYTFEQDVVTPL